MAKIQRKIKPALKRELVDQAGGKCANPGCPNWRIHIHHIKHWAIYKSHRSQDMIAICPSCHDAAHHGQLKITDELLYLWKGIVRGEEQRAHVYIEPANELKLLTGSLCIATTLNELVVFELSNSNHLRLRVLDRDILQVSVSLQDLHGTEFLKVVENNVRVARNKAVRFDNRPGRVRITVPASEDFAPSWLVNQVRAYDPKFAADGEIVALDLEVRKPGLVQVQGCWPDRDVGVVITPTALCLCRLGLREPVSLVGQGERTVLVYAGPITRGFLRFE